MPDFSAKYMPIGVLTAALQELTPREVRDEYPDQAIIDWIDFAKDLNVDCIQLSSALHPSVADVPPEALLDPVANHLDLREPFNASRAQRVLKALDENKVGISDIGYFDDMITGDFGIRQKKYDFMVGIMNAAQWLGVKAVCGFVGRNQSHDMDQNLRDFEEGFIPILQQAKNRGLVYRVEQCPMPGWNTTDCSANNIAYTPGVWIALHKIAKKHGVGDQFRIHYDPSHSILIGQSPRAVFEYLKDQGYNFLIDGFHVKGQVIDSKAIAAWGYWGQPIERGDRIDGKPHPDTRQWGNAWKVMPCMHELPGTARPDPLGYLQNRTVDWLDHQLAAREYLAIDPSKTPLIVEHEYPPARTQDREMVGNMLKHSVGFMRGIDQAAAHMYTMQNEVMPSYKLPVQGIGRESNRC
ncbi:MAG: TIM barrel protein [Nanoarchaeota archaeon]|nr:TIM barrel protein [Nanoarchaeota archaeon]